MEAAAGVLGAPHSPAAHGTPNCLVLQINHPDHLSPCQCRIIIIVCIGVLGKFNYIFRCFGFL